MSIIVTKFESVSQNKRMPSSIDESMSSIPEMEDSVSRLRNTAKNKKGRGFSRFDPPQDEKFEEYEGMSVDEEEHDYGIAQRSIEGWIVFVTGIHEEAQEEDVADKFAEVGQIKNLHLNLDRRTGFIKGYALIEYSSYSEALNAIKTFDGQRLLGLTIAVSWAFVKPHAKKTHHRRSHRY